MMKGKVLVKGLVVVVCLFMLSAPSVMAQGEEPCYGNFDCNQGVDAADVTLFLSSFGRSQFNNPCPTCQDSPCPCTPAPVPKTGQTTLYSPSDDGDLQMGVAWPNPRFTDNGNETVTDNLTRLIWLKNANCFGARNWYQALSDCNGLASGSCGLMDGSDDGDWRLPNLFELESLRDMKYYNPAVPNAAGTGQWSEGDPFIGVQSDNYWSSSTNTNPSTDHAWLVYINGGYVSDGYKASSRYVWPVRGPE